MNAGSWLVLAIVAVIVGLAIKATFFKKKPRGGCCDVGDAAACPSCSACAQQPGSAGCDGCAGAKYVLQPTIRDLEDNQ